MPMPIEHPAPADLQKEKDMNGTTIKASTLLDLDRLAPGNYIDLMGHDTEGTLGQLTLVKTTLSSFLERKRFVDLAAADGGTWPREIDPITGYDLPELSTEYYMLVSNSHNGLVRVSPKLQVGERFYVYSRTVGGVSWTDVTGAIVHR